MYVKQSGWLSWAGLYKALPNQLQLTVLYKLHRYISLYREVR